MPDGSDSRFSGSKRQTGASLNVPQPRLHPLDRPEAAYAAWQMQCRTVQHEANPPLKPFGPSRLAPLLYPLLTSEWRSERISPSSVRLPPNTIQISHGKTQNFPCVDARFIKPTPTQMEDFAVTCQLVPDGPHLISGFCSSPRSFGLGFLQTPPHGDALALLLAFGSANTWQEDFHLSSSVPCLAHTSEELSGGAADRSNENLARWRARTLVAAWA